MFTTGLAIFLGLDFTAIKRPRRTVLRWLRYDVAIDIGVTLLVLVIHFGTFSGVMAATLAGLLTSVGTSAAKRLFGYVDRGLYYPGIFRLGVRRAALSLSQR